MNNESKLRSIFEGITAGDVVPYLGPGVLAGVANQDDGTPIPADSESLILAMNNGSPMAPKLMYEFPRAAMNLELKKGRKFVERFLTTTYLEKKWTQSAAHKWLAQLNLPYIVDCNRDTQLQMMYQNRPHILIVGLARIAGTDYRFKIYQYNHQYTEIDMADVDASLPVLFKPMGTPLPEPNYIASDADYVDYITELMGGFAIPSFVKEYRKGKQYLFMGIRLKRDTERMVLSDFVYASAEKTGWALIPEPTAKEIRFCEKNGIEVIDMDWQEFTALVQAEVAEAG